MSGEEIEARIAIAEAEGWTQCCLRPSMFSTPWLSGLNPSPDIIDTVIPCDGSPPRPPNESDYGWETLPDYWNSRDAIQRAISALSFTQRQELYQALREIKRLPTGEYLADIELVRSEAHELANAFLKAIKFDFGVDEAT